MIYEHFKTESCELQTDRLVANRICTKATKASKIIA
jgi:hypothetical protein